MPRKSVDLNADLGEGCGDDTAMLAVVSSASIACGGHAGNTETMAATVNAAVTAGVRIGAHPGYPDRKNFGRVSMNMELTVLRRSIAEQVTALTEATHAYNAAHPDSQDAHVAYLKPHGALYHDACTNPEVATAICDIAWTHHIFTIMGQAGTVLETVAAEHGMSFEAEGFADRMYTPDGSLMARTLPGAVHATTKDVVAQAVHAAVYGYVFDSGGNVLPVRADTICLHGDTPGALEHALAVQDALLVAGIAVSSQGPPVSTRPAPAVPVVPFGDTALLVNVPSGVSPAGAAHLFTTSGHAHLFTEVVPGADTVLLVLSDPNLMVEATRVVTALTAELTTATATPPTGPLVRIPVIYDGADLPALAHQMGLSVDEVVAEHGRALWTVDFLGFAPGFPYLSSPSTLFQMPRVGTPRAVVPAGSVGVAGGQSCIYPSASPGGWNLLGRADLVLFDPTDKVRPALLTAGTRVQFYRAGANS